MASPEPTSDTPPQPLPAQAPRRTAVLTTGAALALAVLSAALLVALAVVLFARRPPRPRSEDPPHHGSLHRAIAELRAADGSEQLPDPTTGRVDEADRHLRAALRFLGRPGGLGANPGVAGDLARYARLRLDHTAGDLPLGEARALLERVARGEHASEQVRAYARERLDRLVDAEALQARWSDELARIGRLRRTLARLAANDSIEAKAEAHRSLAAFPSGCLASGTARAEAARLRRELAACHVALANKAFDQRRWADALRRCHDAAPYLDDPAMLDGRIAAIERAARDGRTLALARRAAERRLFDEARRLLATLAEQSAYAEEAAALAARIGDTPPSPPDVPAPGDVEAIAAIDRAAAGAFNAAMRLLDQDRPDEARRLLAEARQLARPGTELHRRILGAIDQLPDDPPPP